MLMRAETRYCSQPARITARNIPMSSMKSCSSLIHPKWLSDLTSAGAASKSHGEQVLRVTSAWTNCVGS
jgi:hypothetical protein